jgi:glutamate 5-kinase
VSTPPTATTPIPDLLRREIAAVADTIVVKVGTRILTRPDGALNEQRVVELAEELHKVVESGRRVALVSSGAVGAGMGQLNLKQRPRDLPHLQAVAAIGQCYLVQTYDRALRSFGRHAAQILLIADDLDDRARYLNVRNTLLTLLEYGAVPIISDNDRLAAMVTNLIRAPLLVILSDVDGLFDGDPRAEGSKVIPTVTKLDESIFSLARDHKTGLSKGGMASKLNAARMCTVAGENVIIAPGRQPGSLARIIAGDMVGTLFVAQGTAITSWKRWIGFTAQPRGFLVLDDGARKAVETQGRSLLAIGVVEVSGKFKKGDVVALRDRNGAEFARGLTNYDVAEMERIKGQRTEAIAVTLGHRPYEEVIHRDNMVVTV